MKRSQNQRKENINDKSVKMEESDGSPGSDEPIIKSKRLDEISSQKILFDDNNYDLNHSPVVNMLSSEEWLDRIDEKNMPKVRHDEQLLSQQEIVNRSDVWKGSQVVNYKKFKKFFPTNSVSQSIITSNESIDCVPLKKYQNPYYETNIDVKDDENIELEISSKRRNVSETPVSKKSRHSLS